MNQKQKEKKSKLFNGIFEKKSGNEKKGGKEKEREKTTKQQRKEKEREKDKWKKKKKKKRQTFHSFIHPLIHSFNRNGYIHFFLFLK